MNNKTRQEIFDHVVTALRKQGCKSITNGACSYRGSGGFKCAAGHLIKDKFYEPIIEGQSVSMYKVYNLATQALLNSGISVDDLGLVKDLQNIHDNHPSSIWEGLWENIAYERGIVYTAPSWKI